MVTEAKEKAPQSAAGQPEGVPYSPTSDSNRPAPESPPLDWALYYADVLGWRVLPVKAGAKRPLTPNGFKDATTDTARIREWWKRWPKAGVGVVCEEGGPAVLDLDRHGDTDGPGVARRLYGLEPGADGPASHTGGGGYHCFYAHPGGDLKSRTGNAAIAAGVELKASGYVIVPPSGHPSGKTYEWLEEPKPGPLPELPAWAVAPADAPADAPRSVADAIRNGAVEGERNVTAARVAGKLLAEAPPDVAWPILQGWNQTGCRPPLPEDELRGVFDSIAKRERAARGDLDGSETPAELLAAFNERCGTHIAAATVVGGDTPRLVLKHESGRTQSGTVQSWARPHYAEGVLNALEFTVVDIPLKRSDWRPLARLVLKAARHADPGEEGTEGGAALATLRRYAEREDRPAPKRGKTVYSEPGVHYTAAPAVAKDKETGARWVSVPDAVMLLHAEDQLPRAFTPARVAQVLAAAGYEREKCHVAELDHNGNRTGRSTQVYWRLDPRDSGDNE